MQISKVLIGTAVTLTVMLIPTFVMQGTPNSGLGVAQAASVETVLVNSSSGSKEVEIVRGESVRVKSAVLGVKSQDQFSYQPLPGMAGWFVDHANKKIGNCFRVRTSAYRGWRIQCVWKDLR